MSLTFDALTITYHPTQSDLPRLTSDTDKFLFVIEGQVGFFHGKERKFLNTGDSPIINANTPHGRKAFGEKKAKGILVYIRRS